MSASRHIPSFSTCESMLAILPPDKTTSQTWNIEVSHIYSFKGFTISTYLFLRTMIAEVLSESSFQNRLVTFIQT